MSTNETTAMTANICWHLPNRYDSCSCLREILTHLITKKTPKRIYYVRHQHGADDDDPTIGFVNRQELETNAIGNDTGGGCGEVGAASAIIRDIR